jgi:arylformamidase
VTNPSVRTLDISMPIFAGMPAFPGDPPFGAERSHAMSSGAPYNLSALRMGSHVGTHIDPPLHFIPGGVPVDEIDLAYLNGPCRVVSVPSKARTVGSHELESIPPGSGRVLLRTSNSERWRARLEYFPDYVALAPDGADALLARGCRLVGIDSLSIERDTTGRFPVHHRLLGAGTLILEGLLLAEAPAGAYDLECLPLRIRGGDGGPARAVLRIT